MAVPAPRTALTVAARWSPAALDAPAVLAVGLRLVRQLLQLDRTHDLGDDWKGALLRCVLPVCGCVPCVAWGGCGYAIMCNK